MSVRGYARDSRGMTGLPPHPDWVAGDTGLHSPPTSARALRHQACKGLILSVAMPYLAMASLTFSTGNLPSLAKAARAANTM